jgi:fumarate reductase flavoprotein subunit
MAGMSAALEAAAEGAQVLVVERNKVLGGASRLSNGIMMAAGTSLQRAAGLVDHPDDLFHDYMLANHWEVQPALVRRLVDELPATYDWVCDLGVKFHDELLPSGEERVPRGHATVGQGQGIVDVLSRHIYSNPSIEVLLDTRVDRLLVEAGRVVGVGFGDDEVRSSAVIIATGGFGGNRQLFDKYLPLMAQNEKSWYITDQAVPTAGDAFKLIEAVDGYIEGRDRASMVLCADFNHEPQGYLPGWLVLVNSEGRRFMNEMSPYSVVDPIMRAQGNRAFAVFDHAMKSGSTAESIRAATKVNLDGVQRSHWLAEVLDEQVEAGEVVVADTLEELAALLNLPPSNVAGTIKRYNADAHQQQDTLYMKPGNQMVPVEQGPFYACELRLSLIGVTCCGPAIDFEARILDSGQNPVLGLYGAGECTGGVIGKIYVGSGNSIANCLVYGRVAGRNGAALARRAVASAAVSRA